MAERLPPKGPEEVLEELDDDAIVAQQATAHSPAPRVRVNDDVRTIVVSEPPPDVTDTARVQRLEPGRNDPTMVMRSMRAPLVAAPPVTARRWPAWLPWVIWGFAGLVAFGFGAILALMMAKKDAPRTPPTATARPGAVTR